MSEPSPVTPCFTPGTLISTARGSVPVEVLKRGDKLVTRDNGLRRIYWIGRRDVTLSELRTSDRLQPVMIRAGALGDGLPSRDMLVSPNHRFLFHAKELLDHDDDAEEENLIAARYIIDNRRIRRVPSLGVSYIHLLCDRHQVILANGVWTESFHPDDSVINAISNIQKLELIKLFPEIETIGASVRFRPVRKITEGRSRFER